MSLVRSVVLRHGAFTLVLVALAALYFWLTWYDELGGQMGDGLIYLMTARHYAPYWPEDPLARGWGYLTLFPPAYPALLAATGGTFDFRLAHAATTLCLLGAFAACYAWLLAVGLSRARAIATTLLFALAPGTFLQCFYLHPEGLYVALALAALAGLARGVQADDARALWLAALATGLAILTRTVGVTLLPALAVVLLRARPRHWAGMLALALAPALAWALVREVPWSYTDALAKNYVGVGPEAILRMLGATLPATVQGLADNLVRSGQLHGLLALLGVAALAVALRRFFTGQPDAWYVLAYLAVIAVWPFPDQAGRLGWVIVPLLVGLVVAAAGQLAQRLPPALARLRPALAWLPVAALALAVLPEFALLAARALHPVALANPDYRHHPEWYQPDLDAARFATVMSRDTARALQRFDPQVPADECVISIVPSLAASFYAGRTFVRPPAESLDRDQFERELRSQPCRYFIFTYVVDRRMGDTISYYPLERVRGRVRILDEVRTGSSDHAFLVAALGVIASE